MANKRIGLAGAGRMGSAIGERILAAGFPLAVHNRTAAKLAPLVERGATPTSSPAELVASADIVLTVLTDDAAVNAVYADLLAGNAAGRLFAECSTVRTATTVGLGDRVRDAGARLVDATLAGPPAAARAGQLLVMCGGSSDDVAEATPVIQTYARRIVHAGSVGAGATMKLVLMAPMGAYFAALAEGLAAGDRLGLDRAAMLDVILDSHTAPPLLRDRADVLTGADRPVAFDVTGVRKDLRAIVATGQDAGVPMSLAAAALAHFAGAEANGFGDKDFILVVDYIRSLAAANEPYLGSRD